MYKNTWTKAEISEIFASPLLELVFQAATIHRQLHNPREIQLCTLLNIKTGGCPENCRYCGQSAYYQTGVQAQALMELDEVLQVARLAKERGSTRFCMGAAWRRVRDSKDFERVLEMVAEVKKMGLQVCVTLGMLTEAQAARLKEAGVYAYNHNLDTSEEYYPQITTTRSYQDRLDTLQKVRDAGMTVCCGGIFGMGESQEDRISFLHTLATLPKHPESVPINALIPIEGTPLGNMARIDPLDIVRIIATARILMPESRIRLTAGRKEMSEAEQGLCYMAGANSIFIGEMLLVTCNQDYDLDQEMLAKLGLVPTDSLTNA